MTTPENMPFRSPEELCARLADLLPKGAHFCIGIDGMDGVGKSTLAREMVTRLGGSVISLDDHLTKKQNGYVLHIRRDEVNAALSASTSPIIIEGVCLLAVAHRCGFDVDVLVYVRRISRNSDIWHEEEECMAQRPADELKEKARALRNAFLMADDSNIAADDLGLMGELIDYHAQWRPVERADFLFDVRCA